MQASSAIINFIRNHEGLRLEAYPDPGTGGDPWTIGYGHTGPEVKPGLVITKNQAEAWLQSDVQRAADSVGFLILAELTQGQFDALVSFTFNVGPSALASSTLRKRLNAGEDPNVVISTEFPRWIKGGNGILEGLVKRRQAEIKFALGAMSAFSSSFLIRAAQHYKGLAHQDAALRLLEASVSAADMARFREAYSPPQAPSTRPKTPEPKFPLAVPYFYQRDSKTGHGERMCFSSSMAMALEYINPRAFVDDDSYLQVVLRYGDTVSSDAQIKAAHSLGFDASFHTDGSEQDLLSLLDKGIPVPIGILHKGSVSNPTGGGHWVCLIGYDNTHFMVHDPFGELDLVNGGYPKAGPTDGRNQRYTRKNLLARWLIASKSDGWFVDLTQS